MSCVAKRERVRHCGVRGVGRPGSALSNAGCAGGGVRAAWRRGGGVRGRGGGGVGGKHGSSGAGQERSPGGGGVGWGGDSSEGGRRRCAPSRPLSAEKMLEAPRRWLGQGDAANHRFGDEWVENKRWLRELRGQVATCSRGSAEAVGGQCRPGASLGGGRGSPSVPRLSGGRRAVGRQLRAVRRAGGAGAHAAPRCCRPRRFLPGGASDPS